MDWIGAKMFSFRGMANVIWLFVFIMVACFLWSKSRKREPIRLSEVLLWVGPITSIVGIELRHTPFVWPLITVGLCMQLCGSFLERRRRKMTLSP